MNGMVPPCEPGVPMPETCDGNDNDCDGQTDEELGNVTCGTGACVATVAACENGLPPTCVPGQPQPETCNGVDDDCNSLIDDGLGTISCGLGPCQATVPACVGGQTQLCTPNMAMPEICDGIDNNCNGLVDDGNPDGGTACSTNLPGVCGAGTTVCTNGTLICSSNVSPSPELCDNRDNNCNGQTDEGNPGGGNPCTTGLLGVCSAGTTSCNGGSIICSPNMQASAEICDGLDNNCDGTADEGYPGIGDPCIVPGQTGSCAQGIVDCSNGAPMCVQTVFPVNEQCNGLDDDCDWTVDDGNPDGGGACTATALGECKKGTLNCINGAVRCSPGPITPEICDGLDNNCEGNTDEGNPGGGMQCMTGLPGVCATGLTTCNGMNGVICQATVVPGQLMEACNSFDDDCDGMVDNGIPQVGQPCTKPGQFGICRFGTYECPMGATQLNCNAPIPGTIQETCNGTDDDCDGTIDDGNPGGGGVCTVPNRVGACANGTLVCIQASLVCAETTQPAMTDTCGNTVDDDCDGLTDEAPHSVCSAGPAMPASCSGTPCVNSVCTYGGGSWSYCCNNAWDNSCTLMADAVCGAGTCCAHNVCTLTTPLQNGCSSCVSAICAAKPSCCTTGWTEVCRDRAPMYCNGTSCNVNGQPCPHSVCQTGQHLNTACNACVSSICAVMPSCCATGANSWTQACVNLVATTCAAEWACP